MIEAETTEFALSLRGTIETARIPDFVEQLGGLTTDLSVDISFSGGSEIKKSPEFLANKLDFTGYARETGRNVNVAAKFWYSLTLHFWRSLNRGEQPPVTYKHYPKDTGTTHFHRWKDSVGDLDVECLKVLVQRIDEAASRDSAKPVNVIVDGDSYSVGEVAFWRDFVAYKLGDIDTTTT